MQTTDRSAISRREFARRAALASAAATLSPAELLSKPSATGAATAAPLPVPQQAPAGPKLSPESQAEVDARIQAIFSRYGARLNDAQKADLQRLAAEGQAGLDRLRAFTTDNGDGPALYLKPLMERERKPSPALTPTSKAPTQTGKPSAAPKSS